VSPIISNIDHFTNKGLLTRQRIIEVALSMIRSRGYAETTIQGVCTEVGIAIGTFYHYFRSKEEVLLAYIDIENKNLLNFYAQQDKSSFARAMLAVTNFYLEMYFFKGVNLVAHVYSMMLFSTIEIGKLSEYAFQQILQDAFTRGQASGEFSKEISVETFCNLVLGQWFFCTSLWCNNPETYKIKEIFEEQFKQILQLVSNYRSE
jgi:AcrR family transcriptional regulator